MSGVLQIKKWSAFAHYKINFAVCIWKLQENVARIGFFHYNIISRLQSQSEMIRDISEISGDGSIVYDKEDIKWESLLLSREKAVVMCLI